MAMMPSTRGHTGPERATMAPGVIGGAAGRGGGVISESDIRKAAYESGRLGQHNPHMILTFGALSKRWRGAGAIVHWAGKGFGIGMA
jgi:hypothetical protein